MMQQMEEEPESEINFYSKDQREALLEEDELKNEEDGFMAGYEEGLQFQGEEEEEEDDLEWRFGDQEGGRA